MNPLEERKRLLILHGELQRQSIALEQVLLQRRFEQTREGLHTHRWWVIGATVAAGWFTRKKAGGWLRWLPVAAGLWRMMQNRKKD
jgi:hypothetical protein